MTKHLIALSIFLAVLNNGWGQQGQLFIKGSGQDLYIDHKVSPKEGIFAIGRLYNVHPKAIASYNKLDMALGLIVGQVIHIPLTDTNFSQVAGKGIPVYYTVGDKETIQKVSNVNNRVSLQNLREWNKLQNDNLAAGSKLVVGYLLTGENSTAATSSPKKEEPVKEKKEETGKETAVKQGSSTTKTEEDKPIVKNDPPKEEPKKPEPVVKKSQSPPTAAVTIQGYFKNDFERQVRKTPASKSETVTSGIFKMNSKAQEIKYYLLIDGVAPGTIVRVINPDNNKAVYAKVLGGMSGIRQNQGFDIRISNTAAATLGITDTDKFIVQLNY
jgi:hypothetical protein